MNEKTIKDLLSNVKCGNCGQHCEPANIEVMGHQEDLWFLSVYCPYCRSQGLVVATIGKSDVPEVVNELTETEKSEFSIPVSSDDIIDMHIFLKDFNGDFYSLFSEI